MTKKTAKTTEKQARARRTCDTYPSAPTDPAQRLDWVRRRNAAIAGVDEAEYLDAISGQEERVRKFISTDEGKKP
jgi:hypothetical protein